MPNWCYVDGYFVGEKENLERFKKDFETAQKTIKQGDDGWLGRLVIYNKDDVESLAGNIRGFYSSIGKVQKDKKYNDYYLLFTSSDAWYLADAFYSYVEQKYDIDFIYMAEEPGCEIYETNDYERRFFKDRVILDVTVYDSDFEDLDIDEKTKKLVEKITSKLEGTYYFESYEDLDEYLKKEMGISLEKLQNLDIPNSDDYFYISIYEIVEV